MTATIAELPEILASHVRWLAGDPGGERADLTGANLAGADLSRANLTRADFTGANLTGANLTGSHLTRAYLTGSNLTGSNLRGADLWGANLTGSNLTGANLAGSDLTGANLAGSNLARADLTRANGLAIAPDAPARLQAVAAAALATPDALFMSTWHSCATTHCIAGWAIHQAGVVGELLEKAVGPDVAGLMLLGVEAHAHFHDSDKAATEWLQSVLTTP